MQRPKMALLSVGLAAVLSAVAFAGCTPSNPSTVSTVASTSNGSANASATSSMVTDLNFKADTQFTVSLLFSDNSGYPYQSSWDTDLGIFNQIQQATNVKLNVQVVPSSDWSTKVSTLLGAASAPDIIPKMYVGQEVPYIPSGQIIPVSDYLSYMPNFRKDVNDWNLQDDLKTAVQTDGKFYVLPGLHQIYAQDYSLAIRSDIFQQAGITVPQTPSWDWLKTALETLKQKFPNVTPWSDDWGFGATLQFASPAFGLGANSLSSDGSGHSNWGSGLLYYDKTSNTFKPFATDTNYKAELTYFNSLVSEGLLSKDSFTDSSDQAKAKFETGQTWVTAANSQLVQQYTQDMNNSLGAGNFSIEKINVPSGPAGAIIKGNRLESGLVITKTAQDDPNFTNILRFVDWLWYSTPGQTLTKWGVEGQTYNEDSSGNFTLASSDLGLGAIGLNPTAPTDIRKQYGYGSGNFILMYGGPQELAYSYMDDATKDFVQLVNSTHTLVPNDPPILYTADQLSAQQMLATPVLADVDTWTLKFITGASNLSTDWDSYVSTINGEGLQQYVTTANQVYAAQPDVTVNIPE